MCIYLRDKIGLHYIGQEHVFPAGLGGIAKLPNGFVSDEFNQMISDVELDFIRNSIFTIPRTIEGPGKRGKLAEKYHSPSKVSVLVNEKEKLYALGYTIKNKPYEIPHICLNSVTGETFLNFQDDQSEDFHSKIKDFFEQSKHIDWDKKIELDGKLVPEDLILFGITKADNGSMKLFVAKNELNSFNLTPEMVQRIAEGYYKQLNEPHSKKYHAQVQAKATLSEDHFRILGKIAINFIASEKGLDFISSDRFKPIINWVSSGGENKFVKWIPQINLLGTEALQFPQSSHYVIVSRIHNNLIGYICLYSSFTVILDFGISLTEPFEDCGLICDWKNRKEYSLLEYISTIVVNSNIPPYEI